MIGIGNSDNDLDLLNAVDMKFVIRNRDGYADSLLNLDNAVYLNEIGSKGWEEMIYFIQKRGIL